MDEFISLMVRGIKLVKDVEESLQSLGSHGQHGMASKLDEIIRVFVSARERLINNAAIEEPSLYLYRDQLQQQQHPAGIDPSLHEQWLRSNKSMMELFQTQVLNFAAAAERNPLSSTMAAELGAGTSSGDVQPMASSSSQRPRRRKEDADKLRTIRVPAPIMGNTEIPPEDGYTWRKYGQKEILGSKFPRGYYRCTHQKLYQCPAKKQVQRLDDDPHMYEVTYRGDHTCHMSATAPSIPPPPPPPPPEITQDMTHTMVAVDHPPTWLEFSLGGGSGGGGAGPSTVRYGKEAEYPVADMADVMFNSGSSSSNSMELIFTSMEDHKWDSGDHKKN